MSKGYYRDHLEDEEIDKARENRQAEDWAIHEVDKAKPKAKPKKSPRIGVLKT